MPGISGRQVLSAYARSSTWGTPASVTRQVLLMSSAGLDDQPQMVDDQAFGQNFLADGQIGDRKAITPTLTATMRYEQVDTWIAIACGSAAAPTVVSSQAANSLVAYQHLITLAPNLTQFLTLGIDLTQYVLEVPTFKVRGFTIKVGTGGVLEVSFPISGNRATYTSAVNTNSTIAGAQAAAVGFRMFRFQGQFRMNVQSAGALGSTDVIANLKEFEFAYARPLAEADNVVGQDYIIEPDDDGFADMTLKLTYPRMNTVTANSLAIALGAATAFKADMTYNGTYVNSTTQRQFLLQMPDLQLINFKAEVTGNNQVRPQAELRLRRAGANPSGMAFTDPFRITYTNANSLMLLT